ncbi:5,6-dimethylbenzimidazole synthase [Gordonia aichiensis]|uniref:Putative oxidoreductase n=1 Tax=Gordonia aichiensis NBRC 108223 TaxID=1220583 RepID=L7KRM0_9ACTN|nr:5,6-dimethylbenzimidazole synthase [Gordonia aichiensis]GAC51156.1 putative oxidoreductase [Gordonia aichiensis NBRC 108223]
MTTFDAAFAADLDELLIWRRDVRHFRTDPLAPGLLDELLARAELAPSVGNSQPWRWVRVDSPEARARVRRDFVACNTEALRGYVGERAQMYASLKLSGLDDAPVQLAVFTDHAGTQGHGLGNRTMPETLDYSTVTAVATLWLAARARGVGVGWVSILDGPTVATDLEVPDTWRLTAYLCLGYPAENDDTPELERVGWQERTDVDARRFVR